MKEIVREISKDVLIQGECVNGHIDLHSYKIFRDVGFGLEDHTEEVKDLFPNLYVGGLLRLVNIYNSSKNTDSRAEDF